ncbi:hypothetical protein [Maritimibacter sp. UBA3975]|uniref:hypothetical protein n=1 Tax=Maritimibacter sp. UBA3975 TaxID=1946833 RepID=UPI000C0A6A21|nr:hypothetical protein [Maritimibacter sp. UBA3975]MAM59939.1 hypothetical protein [Maritimibacter sp.]|tara:strand:- start:37817 stop:38056 length:240 start_codon:yes stop_codon:yes gene_type:complete
MRKQIYFTTIEGYAGLIRPLDHARRMGFDLIAVAAEQQGAALDVKLTVAGLNEAAVATLAARIDGGLGCAIITPSEVAA